MVMLLAGAGAARKIQTTCLKKQFGDFTRRRAICNRTDCRVRSILLE